jgi:hypothetical protein
VDDDSGGELFYFYRGATPGYLRHGRTRSQLLDGDQGGDGSGGRVRPRPVPEDREQLEAASGADKRYLERVWLNVWVRSDEQAFEREAKRRAAAASRSDPFKKGELVVAGMDGARFRDSCAIVLTHVPTGIQKLWALWELPTDVWTSTR